MYGASFRLPMISAWLLFSMTIVKTVPENAGDATRFCFVIGLQTVSVVPAVDPLVHPTAAARPIESPTTARLGVRMGLDNMTTVRARPNRAAAKPESFAMGPVASHLHFRERG